MQNKKLLTLLLALLFSGSVIAKTYAWADYVHEKNWTSAQSKEWSDISVAYRTPSSVAKYSQISFISGDTQWSPRGVIAVPSYSTYTLADRHPASIEEDWNKASAWEIWHKDYTH